MRAWKLVLSCVAAATVVTIACDAAHLIDSDAQGTVYALADVDGEPLPLEYTPRYTFHGVVRSWLQAAEILLRDDSTTLIVLQLKGDSSGTVYQRQYQREGRYRVVQADTILWCPDCTFEGSFIALYGILRADELILPGLFYAPSGQRYRLVRR